MSELKINGTQMFLGQAIPVIEGGFGEGEKVILVKDIAKIHNTRVAKINELINNNIDEFEFGIDILDVKNNKEFQGNAKDSGIYTQNSINASSYIYLLSEQGYMLLVGFMRTDKSKEIRKQMRREYFQMREEVKKEQDSIERAIEWISENIENNKI